MISQFLKRRFEFVSISKYRAELMGLAILGVMLGHLMNKTIQPFVLEHTVRLIHTYGFIFLSGFGLYYSFRKKSDVLPFYKKRFVRVYLPYLYISLIFFLLVFYKTRSVSDLFGHLTTIAYWYKGNYYSMWYIPISLFLYLIFPPIYHFLFDGKKCNPLYRMLLITAIVFVILLLIQHFTPEYWEMEKIGFCKILIFPLGIYCGYLAQKNFSVSYLALIPFFLFSAILAVFMFKIDYDYLGFGRTLVGIPLAIITVDFMSSRIKKPLKAICRFLGKYSLELYILHLFINFTLISAFHVHKSISMSTGIILALLLCKPVHDIVNKLIPSSWK